MVLPFPTGTVTVGLKIEPQQGNMTCQPWWEPSFYYSLLLFFILPNEYYYIFLTIFVKSFFHYTHELFSCIKTQNEEIKIFEPFRPLLQCIVSTGTYLAIYYNMAGNSTAMAIIARKALYHTEGLPVFLCAHGVKDEQDRIRAMH